jgi:hypothetical protein
MIQKHTPNHLSLDLLFQHFVLSKVQDSKESPRFIMQCQLCSRLGEGCAGRLESFLKATLFVLCTCPYKCMYYVGEASYSLPKFQSFMPSRYPAPCIVRKPKQIPQPHKIHCVIITNLGKSLHPIPKSLVACSRWGSILLPHCKEEDVKHNPNKLSLEKRDKCYD